MERIDERVESLVTRMVVPIKATARVPIKQAGYISATSAIYAQSLLRNAAGPYIRVIRVVSAMSVVSPLL
jgi:hypothetical protein